MTKCVRCGVGIKPVPTLPDAWQAVHTGLWACTGWIGHDEHDDYVPKHHPTERDPYAHLAHYACVWCDESGLVDASDPLPPLRPFEYLT